MLGRSTSPDAAAAAKQGQTEQPARRFTDTVVGATTLGTLRIHGSITGKDCVRIGGQVEGPIELEGLLHIAEGARVTGTVTADGVVIDGEVAGRVFARGRVELSATARVRAEVHAATVAIAEGCFFDGRIHMGGDQADGGGGPTTFREKRRRRGARGAAPDTAAQPAQHSPAAQPAAPPAPAATPAPAADAPAAAPAPAPAPDAPKGAPPRPTV
jgi:cytoskeletal protein CcmA (bactofilin family)